MTAEIGIRRTDRRLRLTEFLCGLIMFIGAYGFVAADFALPALLSKGGLFVSGFALLVAAQLERKKLARRQP